MTIKMTATQAKARLLGLLDQVAAGEEVEITRHGRTIARLVPANSSLALQGSFSGVAMTASDHEDNLFSTDTRWSLT